jgi:hypothetical protein
LFLRIFNDIHLRGVPQVMTFAELCYHVTSSPYPVIFNGDIYDFSGCKTKELPALYQESILLNNLVKEKGGYILEGNHSCYAFPADEELLLADKILIHHGHRASWTAEKVEEFMRQEKGAGWFKRNMISRVIGELRRFWAVRPNKRLLTWVEAKKKQYPELKEIILAHSHPKEVVYFTHVGVNVRIMPQGMHDLDIAI